MLFNIYFSEIVDEIRSEIPPTSAKPEDYLNYIDLNFEIVSTNPVEVSNINASLNRKGTLDMTWHEISQPLSIVPIGLKVSRTVFKSSCSENL